MVGFAVRHIFASGGGNITETFKSVTKTLLLHELGHHVLYWCMSVNDLVLY